MSISEKYAKIAAYIYDNPIATFSTVGEDGTPHGAVVYVCPDAEKHVVYFLTKNETKKYKDMQHNDNVSLTIVNPKQNSTLQATGRAFTVHDSQALDAVTKRMVRANPFASQWLPPVSKLEAGQYVVVGIRLTHARLAEFAGMELNREEIFTEA
ncbi:MAG TPA: pyridoxamine 5'-phosphate oxidase family protein [Candidatus Saccharimonadales bacterium]